MIKFKMTITFSKLISLITLLAGTGLSWYTKDNSYFTNAVALATLVISIQNAGESYVKIKSTSSNISIDTTTK